MKKINIAILGATSHIAKGLISNFFEEDKKGDKFSIHLYARSVKAVNHFLSMTGVGIVSGCFVHEGFDGFTSEKYDVIINCVGVGTINKMKGRFSDYFTINEKFDNMAISCLQNNPSGLYISFSSGAVYGKDFTNPASKDSVRSIVVNRVTPEEYYSIVRLYLEAKHRSLFRLNIVDLRIFSYFSRFIDLKDKYFITELIRCAKENKKFKTEKEGFMRDYLHPKDLYSAVKECISTKRINAALDISSRKPAEKHEIINYFIKEYDLEFEITNKEAGTINKSPTGVKNNYYSICKNASLINYKPRFSSMETIKEEAGYLLSSSSKKEDW